MYGDIHTLFHQRFTKKISIVNIKYLLSILLTCENQKRKQKERKIQICCMIGTL